MDVIRAIENYDYYHICTSAKVKDWEEWRAAAIEEWKLRKNISEKEEPHGT